LTERQRILLERLGLPTTPPAGSIDDWLAAMRRDKKSLDGRLRFILPRRLGEVALFDDLAETEVRRILGAGRA
jgi:3-dehydroquinate synthase